MKLELRSDNLRERRRGILNDEDSANVMKYITELTSSPIFEDYPLGTYKYDATRNVNSINSRETATTHCAAEDWITCPRPSRHADAPHFTMLAVEEPHRLA